MTEKKGKLLDDQTVQALEDAWTTEKRLRALLIQNPSAASTLEPQISDAMKRVPKLEDDRERLRMNDAKIADRATSSRTTG
jgi:hypothetical protein